MLIRDATNGAVTATVPGTQDHRGRSGRRQDDLAGGRDGGLPTANGFGHYRIS
jgi:hypothetical protein